MQRRIPVIVVLMQIAAIQFYGQVSSNTREEYISKYKDLAVKEMKRTGIPASITMAQGILESGSGKSRLAVKANNHFGIKCHDWDGKKIRHDDDARRECFRKYKSVEESYRDHSDFLTTKSRYASLFHLEPTDYKQWAEGLKKAGYATSPTYAKALIRIIEENQLYLLDQGVDVPDHDIYYADNQKKNAVNTGNSQRQIFENNRVKYIIVKEGDSFTSLTAELDLLPWELSKYNETSENRSLSEGQIVYIQPKRRNAEAGKVIHKVKSGETMYTISQRYGVRLDKLYARNQMETGTEPQTGTELMLRGKVKRNKLPLLEIAADGSENEEEMIFEFDIE
jgi:LysM repeat protein